MHLQNVNIAQLLPLFMREEKDNLALADGISKALQPIAQEIAKLSTWAHLDKLNTNELDALALELSIFWYDHTLTDTQKRAIILNSDKVYMKMGTVAAVQSVVSDVFGEARVEEWFNYNGKPHYFRIIVANTGSMTPENEAKLIRILDKIKRKSQWLESILNPIYTTYPLNVGMSVCIHSVNHLMFDKWQDHSAPVTSGITTSIETSNKEQYGII